MRAYERLIKYAKVSTASEEGIGVSPSTPRQFDSRGCSWKSCLSSVWRMLR